MNLTFRTLNWHNRFSRNWGLAAGNLQYFDYAKSTRQPLAPSRPLTKIRSVTLQGAECGLNRYSATLAGFANVNARVLKNLQSAISNLQFLVNESPED